MKSKILRALPAATLRSASAAATAQVSNIPFPAGHTLIGLVGAPVIPEPTESNAVVFANTRGSNITARLTDFVLTNGGSTACFIHLANASGDVVLAAVAAPPMQTVVVKLGKDVPIDVNRVLRVVPSDLFGLACNSRMVISVRGWFTGT